MNLEYFQHFLLSNFPMCKELSSDDIKEIGVGFKEYLQDKFKGEESKLSDIWNIDPQNVIMAQVNKDPFKMNGYHPALIIHFTEFCKKYSDL